MIERDADPSCNGIDECAATPTNSAVNGFFTLNDPLEVAYSLTGMRHIEIFDTDSGFEAVILNNLLIMNNFSVTSGFNLAVAFTDENGIIIPNTGFPLGTPGNPISFVNLSPGLTNASFAMSIDLSAAHRSPLLFHDVHFFFSAETSFTVNSITNIRFAGIDFASNVGAWPAVPEPATLALFAAGMAGFGFSRRRGLRK